VSRRYTNRLPLPLPLQVLRGQEHTQAVQTTTSYLQTPPVIWTEQAFTWRPSADVSGCRRAASAAEAERRRAGALGRSVCRSEMVHYRRRRRGGGAWILARTVAADQRGDARWTRRRRRLPTRIPARSTQTDDRSELEQLQPDRERTMRRRFSRTIRRNTATTRSRLGAGPGPSQHAGRLGEQAGPHASQDVCRTAALLLLLLLLLAWLPGCRDVMDR